jgi:acyl-CoA synthetase (AMP-forming)/AMP-acid ligase II
MSDEGATPALDSLIEESEQLHARVRAFSREESSGYSFETLALALARFQARACPGYARLVRQRQSQLAALDDIPAVPSDAFRWTRVAVHPPALDVTRFFTSGTTGTERGAHPLRTLRTYAELSLRFGRQALVARAGRHTVVAVAPLLDEPPSSSLGYMMGVFMEAFDGRALDGGPFVLQSAERWLLRSEGVDVEGLGRAIAVARSRAEPLMLLTTSFGLVALLDALGSGRCELPEGSVVMQTGGFKGRVREVDPRELRKEAARRFAVPEAAIVSEYGMTELSSQLYEGTLPGGVLRGEPGVFLEPKWLRVTPVDPVSLEPVPAGKAGLARFVDLANVDSAVAVVTRDLVRRSGRGIELIGRQAGAPPRGCSLSVEALLGAAEHAR